MSRHDEQMMFEMLGRLWPEAGVQAWLRTADRLGWPMRERLWRLQQLLAHGSVKSSSM